MAKLPIIAVGFDHRGEQVARELFWHLSAHRVRAYLHEPIVVEDYAETAQKVLAFYPDGCITVLICGTGVGMCIAANKVKGKRAAVIRSTEELIHAVEHNNINVVCFGAMQTSADQAFTILQEGLQAKFLGGKYATRAKAIEDL
jgi:ribose 5-phosphate isomerase B